MGEPHSVDVEPVDVARLEPLIGADRVTQLRDAAAHATVALGQRRIFNLNSTANGGGVAEILRGLVAYARGLGLDVRWLVIDGDPSFFTVTKRVHNGLYGVAGDGGELGEEERETYERTLARNRDAVVSAVRAGDVVVVHDPQPAGLIGPLRAAGALVVWRCHVGVDAPNAASERAWAFLRPYVEAADVHVFSRRAFAPPWLPAERVAVIAPSIDPFTEKNRALFEDDVRGILAAAGLVTGGPAVSSPRVSRRAVLVSEDGPPPLSSPLVVQVSRWDRLKDMAGVLRAFVDHVDPGLGAHLVLAGPQVDGVDDDPEGTEVWNEVVELWSELPGTARARAHLAAVPVEDLAENARIVNALQQHAAVVVQKSLAEGFGLTVAEAMWKSRPVVASAVGGIVDQVVDGETGILLADPDDLAACGAAVTGLLHDEAGAAQMGRAARERVLRRFLADRHLLQYAELLERLLAAGA
jgi:trehalose synthase